MSEANQVLAAALGEVLRRVGLGGTIAALERLSGGANMESWAFTCGGEGYVLRRAASAEVMAGRPLDMAISGSAI